MPRLPATCGPPINDQLVNGGLQLRILLIEFFSLEVVRLEFCVSPVIGKILFRRFSQHEQTLSSTVVGVGVIVIQLYRLRYVIETRLVIIFEHID